MMLCSTDAVGTEGPHARRVLGAEWTHRRRYHILQDLALSW